MQSDNPLGEYLRARRELVRPDELGLPDVGRRRLPGLRREEVALLAGVSFDYYVRMEQGRDRHPSEAVIEALGRVLKLDPDALEHLRDLARDRPRRRRAAHATERVRPNLLRLMEAWHHVPALVLGRHLDILAANPLGTALMGQGPLNLVRLVFLDPAARAFYPEWERVSKDTVAALRAAAGTDLEDPRLTELVGELSLKSPEFARLWARHDVRGKGRDSKRFHHPLVGELELTYEAFTVNSAPGQQLIVYEAEPGSPSESALALLGSLTAEVPSTRLSQPSPAPQRRDRS